MIVRARVVVPMAGPILLDGAVVIAEGRVVAVGPWAEIQHHPLALAASEAEGSLIDLGAHILLPGLINAHCHLDYTMLRGVIPPPTAAADALNVSGSPSFAAWVGQINAHKAALQEADFAEAIHAGFAELKRFGTTTVCNLAAYPALIAASLPAPIRTWWFPELIDIRTPELPAEEQLLAQLAPLLHKGEGAPDGSAGCHTPMGSLGGDPLSRLGLCPHAPYTASPALYRRCAAVASRLGLPLSTHLAESTDEEAMFHDRQGPLFAFLEKIGRPMGDCGGHSSFGNAVANGLAGPGWLLTHVNELDEKDFARLATTPGPWHIVHCPRSHAYFGHTPFPWARLRELGVHISLGTDSLASNTSLDLFAEMRAAAKAAPWITSESLLETVTTQPAKALGREGFLGAIAPGAHADLIALPVEPMEPIELLLAQGGGKGSAALYNTIVNHRGPVPWMMLEGKLC